MPKKTQKVLAHSNTVTSWYPEYWAQTWYRNTFLVQRPDQIAKAKGRNGDWNNIYDSGCNFTCLAMIVGIDPARLASLLSSQTYFWEDPDLPAKHLADKTGGLVWDQNAPNQDMPSILIQDIWHPKLQRRTSITINYVGKVSTRSYREGEQIVVAMRDRGNHVIIGPEDHSHLVAGTVGSSFFVWDPDDTEISVESNIEGIFTLRRLFNNHIGRPIEFWEYKIDIV
jgi:hypothetical protein